MSGISIGCSHPRRCSGRKTTGRGDNNVEADNVILIDVDSDHFDNVIIIDVPESLKKKYRGSSRFRKDKKCPFRTVICIDDDEITENNCPGIGVNDNSSFSNGASGSRKSCPASKEFENAANAVGEECQFVQENASPVRLSKCKRTYSGNPPTRTCYGLNVDSDTDITGGDYPDCDLMEDTSGNLQEQWEKAFFRRKKDKRNGQYGVRDHIDASRDLSNNHQQHVRTESKSTQQRATSIVKEKENLMSKKSSSVNFSSPNHQVNADDMNRAEPVSGETFFCKDSLLDPGNGIDKSRKLVPEIPSSCNRDLNEEQLRQDGSCSGKDVEKLNESVSNSQLVEKIDNKQGTHNGDSLPAVVNCIINDREKLKETDEYKRAIEEEWASRQQALKIQAEEAQHLRQLRKRKKAESMRLLDMERRQKQRVEEIRESQKKDVENMNLKEVIRNEVRTALVKLEITCHDMASLLHSLGIQVASWPHPSPYEVQTAYKRALLTFHPDRASRSGIRQQVEAEEKFKLINRLKDKFSPSSRH